MVPFYSLCLPGAHSYLPRAAISIIMARPFSSVLCHLMTCEGGAYFAGRMRVRSLCIG
jgi:hypothetical protein